MGDTAGKGESKQDDQKKEDEAVAETPKQVTSSWDSDVVMIGPNTKKGQEEGGDEQDKRSAK